MQIQAHIAKKVLLELLEHDRARHRRVEHGNKTSRSTNERLQDFLLAYPPSDPALRLGGRLRKQADGSFAPGDSQGRRERFLAASWALGSIHELLSRFGLRMKIRPPTENRSVHLDPLKEVAKRRNVHLRVLHGGVDVEPSNMVRPRRNTSIARRSDRPPWMSAPHVPGCETILRRQVCPTLTRRSEASASSMRCRPCVPPRPRMPPRSHSQVRRHATKPIYRMSIKPAQLLGGFDVFGRREDRERVGGPAEAAVARSRRFGA